MKGRTKQGRTSLTRLRRLRGKHPQRHAELVRRAEHVVWLELNPSCMRDGHDCRCIGAATTADWMERKTAMIAPTWRLGGRRATGVRVPGARECGQSHPK